MELIIRDKTGKAKKTVSPDSSSQWAHEVGVENVVNVNFTTWEFFVLSVGDYIEVGGNKFSIKKEYRPKQSDRQKYTYNLKFYGREHDAEDILFCRLTQGEDDLESVFAYDGMPMDFLQKAVQNLNRNTDGVTWKAGEAVSAGRRAINFNGLYCRDALNEIAKDFETEWWVDGEYLNLCKCERGEHVTLGYMQGLKTGLTQQENTNAVKWFTRLIPVGSTKNLDPSKYGFSRLQLPSRAGFIDLNTQLGLKEHREEAAFAEIYPHRTGTVSAVRSEEKTNAETGKYTVYYVKDMGIPFNPDDYMLPDKVIHISFTSGDLRGKDFECNWHNDTQEFEIINTYPDENAQLPGGNLIPADGDTYILWNIGMPDAYITAAEQDYMTAVNNFLSEYAKDVSIYSADTDYIYVDENDVPLSLGQRVRLLSEEYFSSNGGYRDSRITRVVRRLNNLPEATIECSDAVNISWKTAVDSSINSMKYTVAEQSKQGLNKILKSGDAEKPSEYNVFSAVRSLKEIAKRSLSKIKEDSTEYLINFLGGIIVKKFMKFGDFLTGISGGYIDENGDMEMGSGVFRKRLFVPEIAYNRTTYFKGRMVNSPGGGCSVKEWKDNGDGTYTVTPDLTDADGLSQFADDILTTYFVTKNAAGKLNGFEEMKFRVTAADYSRKVFTLMPRPGYDWKPADQMVLAQTGNFTDPERQTYILIDSVNGNNCITFFDKANTWDVEPAQMPAWFGKKKGMTVAGIDCDNYSAVLQNILMTGLIFQIDEITGGKVRVPLDKGEWKTGRYAYYDRVSHNGSLWLCVNDKGTTSEPSENNPDWLKQVSEGKRGDPGPQGIPGAPGADGKTTYTWIRYADTAQGGGISNDPTGKEYIGFAYNKDTAVESNTPSDYKWSKIKGETGATGLQGLQGPAGKDGIPGENGRDGKTPYFHIKYAPVKSPTSAQMTETPSVYIGTYVDFMQADSADPTKYTWSKFEGIDGTQGIPGKNGMDGKTSYLHIAYATSADGSQGFDIVNADGKAYIGQYTDFIKADSTDCRKYKWTLIKGTDGVPGAPGKDGKTTYTWIAYSDNATGTPMYQIPTDTTKYIGIAVNKDTATESNTPSHYTWSLFKGEKGDPGLSVVGGGHWESSNTPYKANTLVSFAGCVFLSNVDTSSPPIAISRFKSGSFRRKKDGGYILAGKSADWQVHPDWQMLLDGRELKGESFNFLGEFASHPVNPENGDTYRNTTDHCTYTYKDGIWKVMLEDGTDGKDAKDHEWIYRRSNIIGLPPEKPDSKQQDDYVPSGWTDDFLGVDRDHRIEWACKRTKRDGVWSEFSTPAVVHRWSKDGESAIEADLTNQSVNAALTYAGLTTAQQSWTTYVRMWSGTEQLALDTLTVNAPSGFTASISKATGAVAVTVAGGKSLPEQSAIGITVTAVKNGQVYSRELTFSVTGVRGGADGSDAVLYSLVTSVTSVKKDKNGNYSVASVSCKRMKTVGAVTSATTDGELKYSRDGAAEVPIGDNIGVASGNFTKSLKFVFYIGGQAVDVETVPMLVDGGDGKNGIDGESIVSAGHWESGKTPYKANRVVEFAGGSYLSKVETSNPPIRIARFKNGNYRRKRDGGYILAGRSATRSVHPDWQQMVSPSDPSISYWLDSPVSTINFTSTGTPSPSAFPVTCKQNVAGNVSTCNTLYLAARKFNGGWLAHVGATQSSVISVPATAGYTQFAVRAYTSASDANSWNDNFIAEKGIGVAVDGKPGDKGDTGATGAFPRDRGVFGTSDGLGAYVWNKDYRDKVIYMINGVYYNFLVRNYGASVTAAPTSASGDSNWEAMQKYVNIATDTLFATGAHIGGFMFVYKDTNSEGVPYGEMRSQAVTNGVPNLLMNTESGHFHCVDANITGVINATQGTFNNVTIQSGAIAGFSITGNGLTNINEDGKFINDAYVIFRNDNYNSFAGIGGNILPPSLGGRAVARFENHDKKNKGIGGFNCAMIVSAQEANQNTAIQMNGGCISGLAYKAISVSSSETLTRDVVSVACLNTGGISITLPDMDVFDDGHVIKIKRLKGVDKDNAVRIYAGYGYHDILNETSKEYVRTKKQTCIRADSTSVYALDPRILPSVGDAIELVYHRDVHIGAYYGCWVEYKHPRDW